MHELMIWFIGGIISVTLACSLQFYGGDLALDSSLDFGRFYPLIFIFSWTLIPLLLPACVLTMIAWTLQKLAIAVPRAYFAFCDNVGQLWIKVSTKLRGVVS